MEKIKLLFKNHWKLVVSEFIPITIYVVASIFIEKNTIQDSIILSIVFSAEFAVSILITIGAIYSWFASQSAYEYNRNLEMLKDIDKIHEYYKDKDSFPDVVKSCQEQIDRLRDSEKYKETFLYTYLSYVESKNGQPRGEEEQFDEQIEELSDVNQSDKQREESSGANQSDEQSKESSGANQSDIDYPKNKSLNSVKNKIGKELSIGKEYIKYSKNYKDGDFQWSTWYSLDEKLIKEISDEKAILFFTNVDGQYKAVKIKGKKLKELSNEMKARNSGSNKIYDFYIRLNKDGKYEECRNNIPLKEFGIEEIDLNFLNKK